MNGFIVIIVGLLILFFSFKKTYNIFIRKKCNKLISIIVSMSISIFISLFSILILSSINHSEKGSSIHNEKTSIELDKAFKNIKWVVMRDNNELYKMASNDYSKNKELTLKILNEINSNDIKSEERFTSELDYINNGVSSKEFYPIFQSSNCFQVYKNNLSILKNVYKDETKNWDSPQKLKMKDASGYLYNEEMKYRSAYNKDYNDRMRDLNNDFTICQWSVAQSMTNSLERQKPM